MHAKMLFPAIVIGLRFRDKAIGKLKNLFLFLLIQGALRICQHLHIRTLPFLTNIASSMLTAAI